jgi:hypothetical protein
MKIGIITKDNVEEFPSDLQLLVRTTADRRGSSKGKKP